jgi:ESS family glutamate:Na+ symporter
VAYFHLARWKGWTDGQAAAAPERGAESSAAESEEGGEMELFTVQIAIVGTVYLLVWFILSGVAGLLGDPQKAGMIYGFHFIIALLVALVIRKVAEQTPWANFTNDRLMGRVAGIAVDLGAVCAIAAVRPDRIGSALVPVVVLALVGVAVTVVVCAWLARRIFPDHPLSHSLVLFGAMTGTLPTGLALLRLTDPDLSGPAARNMVAGASLSVLFAAPVLLVLLPMPVAGWPESFPLRSWQTVGGLSAYVVVLASVWWLVGPLKILRPLVSPWPDRPVGEG